MNINRRSSDIRHDADCRRQYFREEPQARHAAELRLRQRSSADADMLQVLLRRSGLMRRQAAWPIRCKTAGAVCRREPEIVACLSPMALIANGLECQPIQFAPDR